MDRRDFVLAMGAAAGSTLFGVNAFAKEHDHSHHDHGTPKARPVSKQLKELQRSTFECLQLGEICLAQCNAVLAGGKTSMAECQLAVMDMLAVVRAMAQVATYNTGDVKAMKNLAMTCADFCRACEKECKVHAKDHEECKNCMDACTRCIKACNAYVS